MRRFSPLRIPTPILLALTALLPQLSEASSTGVSPERLARRLVLALDGVGYQEVRRAQTATLPCLENLLPAVRNVSTFPSLSDIAWQDITRSGPTEGYQRYHYSVGYNKIIGGGATAELGNTQDYERRMHVILLKPADHRQGYFEPLKLAEKELAEIKRQFLSEQSSPTIYAYMLSTDTLQHTAGDIQPLLCRISETLDQITREYEALTGRTPELAIVSDHGNNQHRKGQLIEVRKNLHKAGFKTPGKIRGPKDVVFTTAGILNSMSVFALPESLRKITQPILETEGVDLLTFVTPEDPSVIELISASGDRALIRKKPGAEAFSFVPLAGDPLGYGKTLETFRQEGLMDAEGFVAADSWLKHTSALEYPVAPERIWRGHHVITLNPAPMLVSLKHGFEITYGILKAMSSFVPRGGTHGALSAASSNGVFASNFVPDATDTTTNRVGQWLGFKDMRDWKRESEGARLIAAFGDESRARNTIDTLLENDPVALNLWDPDRTHDTLLGVETRYEIRIREKGCWIGCKKIDSNFAAAELIGNPQDIEFRIPFRKLTGGKPLEPGTYKLEVTRIAMDQVTGLETHSRVFFKATFGVDLDGAVILW